MFKSIGAILAAAAVAATITVLSSPGDRVAAGPMPRAASDQMAACAGRPWPYLRCVGTQYGKPGVRLVTAEKLGG